MPYATDWEHAVGGKSPDWQDIRIFAEVVDTGSFSEAAQSLGINQATVSRRIARLEKSARTILFERSGSGVTLTAAAAELVEIALRARRLTREFEEELNGLRSTNVRVRIKATERIYNYMLTPLKTGVPMGPLQDAIARHPDLLMPGIQLVSAEAGGEADISLIWSGVDEMPPEAEPDDKIQLLARLRYGIFYAEPYFAGGRPVPRVLDDLAHGHSLVSLPHIRGTESPSAWGRWFSVVDRAGDRATVVEWASVSERLVLSGSALALLPVYTPCLSPSLRELRLEDEPLYLNLWKATRRGAARNADVREISDKLVAAFSDVDWTVTRNNFFGLHAFPEGAVAFPD